MKRQTGFTLIEVLVALAILAIVLAASIRATGVLANGQSLLRERSLASFSADNAMALVRIEPQRAMAETSTSDCPQADLNFSCTVRTGPTPNPALRRIEVEVVLPDDLSHPLARRLAFFSTFK